MNFFLIFAEIPKLTEIWPKKRFYVLTYLQVIFQGNHSTQKICKQKSSQMIQVNVPNFFYFAEIPKLTEIWPKNRFFYNNKKKFHPSQNLCKQKSSEMIQVNVPFFFILPNSRNWPKYGQKTDFTYLHTYKSSFRETILHKKFGFGISAK